MDYSLYDQLQTPVFALDKEGKLVYFNYICVAFFHMPPRKLKQAPLLSDLIKTQQADLEALRRKALEENTPKFTREIIATVGENNKDSALILKFVPLENRETVVQAQDFSIERQLHEKYKRQILELKETHEQIVRSDKLTALGELIAGISHEIATPLTIVADRLNQMERALSLKDLTLSEKHLNDLQSQFARIGQIIGGMQSYAGNQEDELKLCDLNKTVAASRAFVEDLNLLKGIELETPQSAPRLVMGNSLKLQQVFINLIKNSADALRSSGVSNPKINVEIEERPDEQIQLVRVRDNGPGIRPDHREKVFDMFYTSKEVGEGTGLGLNISQKIVEGHNGEIFVEDVPSGCSFVIKLPVAELGSFAKTNRYLRGESDTEDEKVLIVGDDLGAVNSVYKILSGQNKICILTGQKERLGKLAEFFAVDRVALLAKRDVEDLEIPVEDLSSMPLDEVLKLARKGF